MTCVICGRQVVSLQVWPDGHRGKNWAGKRVALCPVDCRPQRRAAA